MENHVLFMQDHEDYAHVLLFSVFGGVLFFPFAP